MSPIRARFAELQRELKLRNYSPATVRNYTIALYHFLNFCKGRASDLVNLIKDYSLQMKFAKRSPKGANWSWRQYGFSVMLFYTKASRPVRYPARRNREHYRKSSQRRKWHP